MAFMFRLPLNLTLLGKPGSGKGFYGRYLADAWKVPIHSVSGILRDAGIAVDDGKFIDCDSVSSVLLEYLQSNSSGPSLMDGFPRTPKQVELMREWPHELQYNHAFLLDVPDKVCSAKIIGRRLCSICGGSPNVADVQDGLFDLPAVKPNFCTGDCNAELHWSPRPDDTPMIVQERLEHYERNMTPIFRHYETHGSTLLRYTPYRGERDIPELQKTIEEWLLLQQTR